MSAKMTNIESLNGAKADEMGLCLDWALVLRPNTTKIGAIGMR